MLQTQQPTKARTSNNHSLANSAQQDSNSKTQTANSEPGKKQPKTTIRTLNNFEMIKI